MPPEDDNNTNDDNNNAVDLTTDAAKEAIALAVEKEVSNIKLNRDEIIREKKILTDKLKAFDGINADEAKTALEKLIADNSNNNDDGNSNNNNNDSNALDLQKQLDDQRRDFDAKISDLQKNTDKFEKQSNSYKKQLIKTTVGNEIRNTAAKAGVLPEALDDVVNKASNIFSMGTDGVVEARDTDGNLRKDESDFLLTPERYLKVLKSTHSYYWPSSISGNLDGGGGGNEMNDIASAMSEAAASGNNELYRTLRDKQTELLKKK